MSADLTMDIHDIQIFLDATAALTADGLAEGGLQVKDFKVYILQ